MFVRLTALALLATSVTSAWAGPEPEAVADRLTERMGLAQEDADAVAAILMTAKEEIAALRAQVKEQAQALKSAKDAGDEKAMRKTLSELRRTRRSMEQVRQSAEDDVFDLLTVEQQAMWTLAHLHRKAKTARAMQRVKDAYDSNAL